MLHNSASPFGCNVIVKWDISVFYIHKRWEADQTRSRSEKKLQIASLLNYLTMVVCFCTNSSVMLNQIKILIRRKMPCNIHGTKNYQTLNRTKYDTKLKMHQLVCTHFVFSSIIYERKTSLRAGELRSLIMETLCKLFVASRQPKIRNRIRTFL